jgi:hypothetical protein
MGPTDVRCSGQSGLVLLGPSFSESDPTQKCISPRPVRCAALAACWNDYHKGRGRLGRPRRPLIKREASRRGQPTR